MSNRLCVLFFAVMFWLLETRYFGWNWSPQSPEEVICDGIVLIDDGSTDDTAAVASQVPSCRVISRESTGWWGQDETTPRSALWASSCLEAGPDGWVYIADADHEITGISPLDLRTCLKSTVCNAFALPLWDCWDSPETLRVDGFWQAHLHPRPWLFKVPPPEFRPLWPAAGIHSGHYPPNLPLVCGRLPGAAIRHYGYISPAHREAKAAKYLALA